MAAGNQTFIRARQILDGTISELKLDQPLQDKINGYQPQIDSILNTMSTDAERLSAVSALTTAFQNADGTLQGALQLMIDSAVTAVSDEVIRAQGIESGLRTDLTAVQTALGLLQSDLNALAARVSANEASIGQLQIDVSANAVETTANATAITSKVNIADLVLVPVELVGVVDGVNKVFTIPFTPSNGQVCVYSNGVAMLAGRDYDLVGNVVTTAFTPDALPIPEILTATGIKVAVV